MSSNAQSHERVVKSKGLFDAKIYVPEAAGIRMEEIAVIAAVKLGRSAFVCAVDRDASAASGRVVIPALRLLLVALILWCYIDLLVW